MNPCGGDIIYGPDTIPISYFHLIPLYLSLSCYFVLCCGLVRYPVENLFLIRL
ncbi:hypothetical protein BJX63DRAFT_132 [Aspergillus granulosus]|uniref:Uncharacterized protein n=1 Tax=Aspergillus granulosus TaxID=176169 RepID=A0ABR4I7A0_9EURO